MNLRTIKQDNVKLLDKAYQLGLMDGLAEGYRAAQRIFVWYSSNKELIDPHPEEKIEMWSINELKELKRKLSE